MGLQDRDYYRKWMDGRSGSGGGPWDRPLPHQRGPNEGPAFDYGRGRARQSASGGSASPYTSVGRSRGIRAKHFFLLAIALMVAGIVWGLLEAGVFEDLGDEITDWFAPEIQVASVPIELNFVTRADDIAEDTAPAGNGSGSGTLGVSRDESRSASAPPTPPIGPPAECPDDAELLLAGSGAPARPKSGIAAAEVAALRYLILDLTNHVRRTAGLSPVRLGANLAPQEHAEDMAESCFLSHWGTNGMKPYMRYSRAGGVQANAENVSGSSFCPADPWRYDQQSLAAELQEAFDGLMNSPGHRANILRPEHRLLHVGMSYRAPNFWLVQQFSGHYAAFAQPPAIEDGWLTFDMSACNGARVSGDALAVQVRHDPLPSPLTPGQLQRTSCVSSGHAIAGLRPPLERGWYTDHTFRLPAGECLDPHLLDPRLPTAQSYEEMTQLKVPARSGRSGSSDELGVWITADRWDVDDGRARVAADLSALLRAVGGGAYTVLIWGSVRGDDVPIAEYSIFVE